MKILLTLFVLLFSSCVIAEDISDFQIEGISIGDSLLDYMAEEEIITFLKRTRYMYEHLSEDFGEVYIYDGLKTYDVIAVFVETNFANKYLSNKNKEFKIYRVRGVIDYIEDLNGCHKKQNEIVEDFSKRFKDARKIEQSFKHSIDPTGRSTMDKVRFIFDSGDQIQVHCSNFEENLRIKNNWSEGLSVVVSTKEVFDWFLKK